jgi:hypothetical protein
MSVTEPLPHGSDATELITLVLTPQTLCLVAALVCHKEQLLQAPSKESGRALLFEHVNALAHEQDTAALICSTQTALTSLSKAITLEYYRVTFVAVNYTDETWQRFIAALKEMFPDSQRYVCTLWDYNNQPPGKPNDLGVRVYVPVAAGQPDPVPLIELVADLKGIQFDGLAPSWLGEREQSMQEGWVQLE